MRQFFPVFRHEFKTTAKSGAYIFTTILFALAFLVGLGFPALLGKTAEPMQPGGGLDELMNNLIATDYSDKTLRIAHLEQPETLQAALQAQLSFGTVLLEAQASEADLLDAVTRGEVDYALYFADALHYTFYTQQAGMTDLTPYQIDAVILGVYQSAQLAEIGATAQQAQAILTAQTEQTLVATKNDGSNTSGYTMLLNVLMMITIMIYGGIVAGSVATEKSSRAMELLVTAARPSALIFGKVLGVGCAGLAQLLLWILTALAGYKLSGAYWDNTPSVSSLFVSGNGTLLLFVVIFFVLGYLLYSFLFGALGSLVSRTEDLQSTMMPVTMSVLAAFYACYFSTVFNYTDSAFMKVLSYLPFTSPLAMFIRMSTNLAAPWEVALSLAILVASIVGVGLLATAIYRVGVLLYGKPPKLRELLRLIRH